MPAPHAPVCGSVDLVQLPAKVLDLFAVPGDIRPLRGGQGGSVVAGDLVLSPGRDAETGAWLNPVLARLAVDLDTRDSRRSLRIAMPIPTRDGRWVVDGWGASRFEPDTRHCADLDVLLATGRLLHAELRRAVTSRPPTGDNRWTRAERAAFDATNAPGIPLEHGQGLVDELTERLDDTDLGPDQLVHGDLAGNVLLDAGGTPVVIDVAPYWRPALWAEAVCVLDAVLWHGADPAAMAAWSRGRAHQAMLRAALFRLRSDDLDAETVERYDALMCR
jgi:uncharacterized protein (TIGR02569 family)